MSTTEHATSHAIEATMAAIGSTAGNADYDTVGFPPYQRFFGVETWMSTLDLVLKQDT